ncbi:MAG: hypothetical protein ABFD92_16875 [Planctomycetaceae bacterium]|nr:hypothetical protein [Planctomycetaceae bacterium]
MTIPTELFPDDSELNALAQTQDADTGFTFLEIAEAPSYTSELREQWHLQRMVALSNSLRVVKDGALTFGVMPGAFMYRGASVAYAGSRLQALVDDNTNYIYLTSAGALTVNQTGFPAAAHVPLATIVTASGDYDNDDITDQRGGAVFAAVGQQELTSLQVDLVSGVIDPDGTVMDATGGAGLFKRVLGGWGSGTFVLQGEDAQGNTKTDTLAAVVQLPADYIADADVKINVRAKYAGAGTAGASKTIDAEVYELSVDGAVGADLCATAAITLTGSFADCTFTITDAGLVAGDRLMVLIRTVLQETGGASALAAQIGSIALQYDRAVGA